MTAGSGAILAHLQESGQHATAFESPLIGKPLIFLGKSIGLLVNLEGLYWVSAFLRLLGDFLLTRASMQLDCELASELLESKTVQLKQPGATYDSVEDMQFCESIEQLRALALNEPLPLFTDSSSSSDVEEVPTPVGATRRPARKAATAGQRTGAAPPSEVHSEGSKASAGQTSTARTQHSGASSTSGARLPVPQPSPPPRKSQPTGHLGGDGGD